MIEDNNMPLPTLEHPAPSQQAERPVGQTGLRRLMTDTGWMAVIVIGPMLARLAVTPIRVRMLGPAEFGDVALWAAVVAVVGGFAVWPATGLMRFLPSGTLEDRARLVRAWLVATVATAAVATIAFAAWALHDGSTWLWVAVVSGAEVFTAAGAGYARAIGRFRALAAISLSSGLGGAVAGTLLIPPIGSIGVLVGWAAADLVAIAICAFLLGRPIATNLRAGRGLAMSRLVRFSAPLAVSNGTWALVSWLDRPLLAALVPRAAVGVYSLAYTVVAAPLCGLFVILSSTTWNHAVAAYEQNGYVAARELLDRSARFYTATAIPIAVWLSLYANSILSILAPRSYAGASRHVVWLAIGLWLFGLLPYRNQHLMLRNRSRAAAVSPVAALVVNVVSLCIAVPLFGAVGAAVATALAYATALGVASWICQRDGSVNSRLPVRLSTVCFGVSMVGGLALKPVVDASNGRLAEVVLLGGSCAVLVAACIFLEGTVWRGWVHLHGKKSGSRSAG